MASRSSLHSSLLLCYSCGMTNESKSLLDGRFGAYLREFLAKQLGVDGSLIESYEFRAETSGGYSEYTEWDFSCDVTVTLKGGERKGAFLTESDVVGLLNGWPNK